jgi:hypothetical protein
MAEAWATVLGAFDDLHMQVDEYREIDDRQILVLFRFAGRGKGSHVDLGLTNKRVANVFEIVGGRVVKLVTYWDVGSALAYVGAER